METGDDKSAFTDQEWRDQPVSILKVEQRASYIVRRFETVGQLMDWLIHKRAEALRVNNFGLKSYERLLSQLQEKRISNDGRIPLLERRKADTIRQISTLEERLIKKRGELTEIERIMERFSHA